MLLVIGAIGLVVGVVPALSLLRYTTTNPSFCLGCHSTGETTDVGKKSLVHPSYSKVPCIECHADPARSFRGLFIVAEGYRGGFSAEPERVSANCRRCHGDILKGESPRFKFNALNIKIPHRFHVETVGVRCTECHSNITHEKSTPATNRPHMEACLRCHAADAKAASCRKCHPTGLLPLPQVALASPAECSRCHSDFQAKAIKFANLDFSHPRHQDRGIKCSLCHSNTGKHGSILLSREACMSCHHGPENAQCSSCHGLQRDFYQGSLPGRSGGITNPMVGKVGCRDCHDPAAKHSLKTVSARCLNCHGQSYGEIFAGWEAGLKTSLEQVGALLKEAEAVVTKKAGRESREANALLDHARRNYELVVKGKGLHNPDLAEALLSEAKKALNRVLLAAPVKEAAIKPARLAR